MRYLRDNIQSDAHYCDSVWGRGITIIYMHNYVNKWTLSIRVFERIRIVFSFQLA